MILQAYILQQSGVGGRHVHPLPPTGSTPVIPLMQAVHPSVLLNRYMCYQVQTNCWKEHLIMTVPVMVKMLGNI